MVLDQKNESTAHASSCGLDLEKESPGKKMFPEARLALSSPLNPVIRVSDLCLKNK